jgi:uncharacterized protein YndB with AHSA1/START domain/DNA-binding transcriptional ArsR family regulator
LVEEGEVAMRDELSRTFGALSDPTRRFLLERLTEGSATVGELAEPLDLSLAAVSKHLQVLERAGLVSRTRDRRFRPASLDARPLVGAVLWLRGYDAFLQESFDALERQLAASVTLPIAAPEEETGKKEPMTRDTITITRRFTAPADAVFDAWLTPERFAAWFGGDEAEVPLDGVALDAREGGEWSVAMHLPGDLSMNWGGRYLVIDRPHRLVFTMTDDPAEAAGDPISVDFTEVDGATEMTLRQTGTAGFTAEQYDATVAGYNAYFDALESALAAVR